MVDPLSLDIMAGEFRTCVRLSGDPGMPVLLLLHDGAYGTDGDLCWGPIQRALSDSFFVVAPDLLGWGRSDKVAFFDRSPYDPRLRQIAAICRTLCLLDRAVSIVGVSFGAELAVRASVEPHWGIPVMAAVSISGTGGRLYRVDSALKALGDYDPSFDEAKRLTEALVSGMGGLDVHAQQRFENSLTPGHWEALSASRLHNPAIARPQPDDSWIEKLALAQVPILFVEGRDDTLMESGWSEKMAKLVPGSSWRVMEGGHEPNLDHPTETVGVIREFLCP